MSTSISSPQSFILESGINNIFVTASFLHLRLNLIVPLTTRHTFPKIYISRSWIRSSLRVEILLKNKNLSRLFVGKSMGEPVPDVIYSVQMQVRINNYKHESQLTFYLQIQQVSLVEWKPTVYERIYQIPFTRKEQCNK